MADFDEKLGNAGERTTPDSPYLYEFQRVYRYVSDRYGDPAKSVLDYGCGAGYGTSLLADSFGRVVGVDVSDDAISYCSKSFIAENLFFHTFDPNTQPYPDLSFDLIFSFQVFEHIPVNMAASYLENIYNMLAIGGTAVITTPKSENYFGGHSGNIFHTKEYTFKEMQNILRSALPNGSFQVDTIKDVASTRARLFLKKYGRNSLPFRLLGAAAKKSIALFERSGFLRTSTKGMISSNLNLIGSHIVTISKSS